MIQLSILLTDPSFDDELEDKILNEKLLSLERNKGVGINRDRDKFNINEICSSSSTLKSLLVATGYIRLYGNVNPFSLGRINLIYFYYGTTHFTYERLTKNSLINPIFESCCGEGQFQLPRIEKSPALLRQLYKK